MIAAIAYDFDGVLVESVEVKTQAFATLFAGEGPDVVGRVVAYHRANGGMNRVTKFRHFYREFLHRPLSEPELEGLCQRFSQLVFDAVIAAPWVPGVPEILETVSRQRVAQFVVSATPEPELQAIVQARGIGHYFQGIFGAPESKGRHLASILVALRCRKQELVFIGDAVADDEAAREVGIRFIARRTAENTDLLPILADRSISDFRDFDSVLQIVQGSGRQVRTGSVTHTIPANAD